MKLSSKTVDYSKEIVFDKSRVVNSFEEFKQKIDVIVANRLNQELFDVKEKMYTRDLFVVIR